MNNKYTVTVPYKDFKELESIRESFFHLKVILKHLPIECNSVKLPSELAETTDEETVVRSIDMSYDDMDKLLLRLHDMVRNS